MILDLIKNYSKFSTKELALHISNKTGLQKNLFTIILLNTNQIIEIKLCASSFY